MIESLPGLSNIPVIVGSNLTEETMLRVTTGRLEEIMGIDEAGLEAVLIKAFKGKAKDILRTYKDKWPKATPGEIFFLIESDAGFRRSAVAFSELKAQGAEAPVYMYLLEWKSGAMNGMIQAAHGLEVPLVMQPKPLLYLIFIY